MIKTILFDLDGTLLPMDMKAFQKSYFGNIAKTLAPLGYAPQDTVFGVLRGVERMTANDGSETNETRFWEGFSEVLGADVREKTEGALDRYYREQFDAECANCTIDPEAAETVRLLKEKGYRVVLATNPFFPQIATQKRILWTGLALEEFEVYTSYEDWHYCKPNPKYFAEICERLGLNPAECLMVGNDVQEDMVAEQLGMQVFLMPACLINRNDVDYSCYPQGDFEALLAYLDEK